VRAIPVPSRTSVPGLLTLRFPGTGKARPARHGIPVSGRGEVDWPPAYRAACPARAAWPRGCLFSFFRQLPVVTQF